VCVSDRERQPIGVILAGGLGLRIGGDKAIVAFRGRPLIAYPLQAMGIVTPDLAVVAKSETNLPELPGVQVWLEPERPRHPLVGIVHALARAQGRPVLVCAADMPLITAAALRSLASADAGPAPAVIAISDGALQPQLGFYLPAAGPLLAQAAQAADQPLRAVVSALRPAVIEVPERVLFNVNTPEDLEALERLAP
jgi:molybdenum cofactor guanylyltransferase